jgi:hypothetical protein
MADSNNGADRVNKLIEKTLSKIVESADSSNAEAAPNTETGVDGSDEPEIVQDLTELPISAEFAGMILFACEQVKAKLISYEQMMNLIRQFYEFDTGEFLRPTQVQALMQNPKTAEYMERTKKHVLAKYERRQKSDLSKLDEKLKKLQTE